MFTPSIPTSLSKPYDIALTLVTQAAGHAKAAHDSGMPESAAFQHRHLICVVFTTPSGQLRYQVGIGGKPTRNSTHMMRVLVDAEREAQEAAAKRDRTVQMEVDVNYCEGHAPVVTLKGKRLLALPTNRGYSMYFHVGAVPRGQEGRKEHGGPMVPGPWAWAGGCATVISASKAHQDRDAAERAAALVVEDGSLIRVDGVEYRVGVIRGEYLRLDAVDNVN